MSLRNVIYYNTGNKQISLGVGISQLPYTDVIVANLQPASANDLTLVGWGNAFDDQLQNNIRLLQNAGKNVLISFGGSIPSKTLTTAAYQSYAQDVPGLVRQLVNFVTSYNFNGVDIDYEDDNGFGNNAQYDGVGFLSELTNGLYQALPSGKNIITHAPAPGYWNSGDIYARGGNAPYVQIWQNVGNQIAWFNNQFYDNPGYDDDVATKVAKYQAIAGITGPQKQLMGALLSGPGTGVETLDDMVQNVIPPLKAKYGSEFGGVMSWEFSDDQGGAWANGIGQALGDLFVFYQGAANSGGLWYTVSSDSINWTQHTPVPNLQMKESPSAVLWQGGIQVFHQAGNGQLWRTFSPDGNNWGTTQTDAQVPGVGMSGSPSAVVY